MKGSELIYWVVAEEVLTATPLFQYPFITIQEIVDFESPIMAGDIKSFPLVWKSARFRWQDMRCAFAALSSMAHSAGR